jgi:Ca2+-binding RTX toxin-like protein
MPVTYTLTPDTLVNTGVADSQYNSDVTRLGDGTYIVVWQTEDFGPTSLHGQRYAADWTELGDEFAIAAHEPGAHTLVEPRAVALAGGGFAVVWHDSTGLSYRTFETDGDPVSGNLTISGLDDFFGTPDWQIDVAPTSDGFVVSASRAAFPDFFPEGDQVYAIFVEGTMDGTEVLISEGYAAPRASQIVQLASGDFLISWTDTPAYSAEPDAESGRPLFRIVSPAGVPGPVQSATAAALDGAPVGQGELSYGAGTIALLTDGGFVLSWTQESAGQRDLYQRRYDSDGDAVAAPMLVATDIGAQGGPLVTGLQGGPLAAGLSDGGWLLVWHVGDPSDSEAVAQRFDADGNADGPLLAINTHTDDIQYPAAIIADDAGGFTILFESQDQDGDGYGVYMVVAEAADPGAPIGDPDQATTDEATATDIIVLANDSDTDGPALSIAEIDGEAAVVDSAISLASGATATLRSDGKITYDPNGAFDRTPTGSSGASNQPASDSFQYKLTGGGLVTVTLTIDGLDSNDLLLGTAGADTLIGGIGNDAYRIGNAADTVTENATEGNDTVVTSVSWTLGASQSVETMGTVNAASTSAVDLTGNDLAQSIYGNAGANKLGGGGGKDYLVALGGDDELDGGTGADNMRGGTDSDIYYVDDLGDAIFEAIDEGDDKVVASASYALSGGADVEEIDTSDSAATTAINLSGNEFAQTLTGNAGNNVLNGHGGADHMVGLAGNDIYAVDNALDTILEIADGGDDRLAASTSYELGKMTRVETLGTSNEASTSAIDLTGNAFNNSIYGNSGSNVLSGGGGNDALRGLAGDDVLRGGTGHDNLRGGAGADHFQFDTPLDSATNVDQILDFNIADDTILLNDSNFGELAPGALDAEALHIGASAAEVDDRIIYDSITGSLYYDADGSDPGKAIQFATLDAGLALTAGDFTVI